MHGFATLLLENQLRGFPGDRPPAELAPTAGPEVLRQVEAGLLSEEIR